jgi:uncharacterized protein
MPDDVDDLPTECIRVRQLDQLTGIEVNGSMLTRDFKFSLKELSNEGSFEGFASTYGNQDLAGDVVERGAFSQAIKQQPPRGYPLLWKHDEPIGTGVVQDSKDGLIVHGSLLMSDPAAARAHSHLKAGTVRGLSIGFTLPRGENKVHYRDDGARVLREIHLHEVSIVAVPANQQATVFSVKSLDDVRHMLKTLRDGDVTEEVFEDLREIDFELKRLLLKGPQSERAESLRELQAFANQLKQISRT